MCVLALAGGCESPADGGGAASRDGGSELTGTVTIRKGGAVVTSATTGETLTAGYSGDETVSYQWNKGGVSVGTDQTYTPAEAGSYTVTVSAQGYRSLTSAAVTVTGQTLPALSGTITIRKGGAVVTTATTGETLTAGYSGDETVSYQWNKGGVSVGTDQTYTPAEAGSYTVTVSVQGYRSLTSAAVSVSVSSTPAGETKETAIPLTENRWKDIEASYGEQWLTFTATASNQYLHVNLNGTLHSGVYGGVYVEVYDSANTQVGTGKTLDSSSPSTYYLVTSGAVYYIRAANVQGSFQIGFTGSASPPSATSLPSTGVTALSANAYVDSPLVVGKQRWFRFTATAATQYIHVDSNDPYAMGNNSDNYKGVQVNLYNSDGTERGSKTLYNAVPYSSWSVTPDTEYYMKTTAFVDSDGTYQIGFSNSSTPPPITPSDVATLTENTWSANIDSKKVWWFRFTATAATQYIHTNYGGSRTGGAEYVRLYDSDGVAVGPWTDISGRPSTQSLTAGAAYYLAVFFAVSASTDASQIGFTGSSGPLPGATAVPLTADADWTNGNLLAGGEEWFKFTASAFECIDFQFVGTVSVYVRLYDSKGVMIDGPLLTKRSYWPSAASGDYYIKVTSDSNGTYQIKFTSESEPSIITSNYATWVLTANKWFSNHSIYKGYEQWFKFTATDATQYLHIATQDDLYAQIYDSAGNALGDSQRFFSNNSTYNKWEGMTAGATYFIKIRAGVWAPDNNSVGYNIAFSASSATPTS